MQRQNGLQECVGHLRGSTLRRVLYPQQKMPAGRIRWRFRRVHLGRGGSAVRHRLVECLEVEGLVERGEAEPLGRVQPPRPAGQRGEGGCAAGSRARDGQGKVASDPVDARQQDAHPARIAADAGRQREPPNGAREVNLEPAVAELVLAACEARLQPLVPGVEKGAR